MIVDWAENCEKIMLTKELSCKDPSDNKSKYKQEVVYIKYLKNVMGMDREQCFYEWKLIKNGVSASFAGNELQLEVQFDKIYKKAVKTRYQKLNYQEKLKPIILFQEEIDFLNSLDVPFWVRQYWGCLLFYYKFEFQNTNRVQKSPTLNSWAIRHTELKQQRYGSKCQDKIAKYQSQLNRAVIESFIKTSNDKYPSYYPAFLKESGSPVFVATKIDDISDFLELLQPTKRICTVCGAEFVVNSKSKRTICDYCYKIYRRQYKTQNKRLERAKKADVDRNGAIVLYGKGEKKVEKNPSSL